MGLEEVRKGFAGLWKNYPDPHFEPEGEDFFSHDRGCREWVFTGTRKSDGKTVRARECDVNTFENGKAKLKNSMQKQEP